jgi:hypothetical protein
LRPSTTTVSDATAFVTTLTFAGDGRFTGTMTPLTLTVAVPEADKYLLLLVGLGALVVVARRSRSSAVCGSWLSPG